MARVLLIVLTVVLVGLVIAAGLVMSVLRPSLKHEAALSTSTRNLGRMAQLMSEHAAQEGWPELGGKRFVLSLLVTQPDAFRNPFHLGMFFSPKDAARDRRPVPAARWAEVTRTALEAGMDVDDLTSYAGRRNDEAAWRIPATGAPVPILADVGFEDLVLVAFSDGSTRTFTREELGIGPDEAIEVGEDAKSEILRALSLD